MLNVKQGNCEYQFFKSFGLTRRGNRSYVLQRGWRSNRYTTALVGQKDEKLFTVSD